MDGLRVTIRLLDPRLREFQSNRTALAVRVAAAEQPDSHDVELLDAVNRMHEENPMLGLGGVRHGLVVPGLVAMQVRAVAEAVVARAGGSPYAEIMVPLVGAVGELRIERAEVERVLDERSEGVRRFGAVPGRHGDRVAPRRAHRRPRRRRGRNSR
ncbi:phosphoenolpyruvate synthase/pyruvate phosphate dikinase [Streptomyces tendae]